MCDTVWVIKMSLILYLELLGMRTCDRHLDPRVANIDIRHGETSPFSIGKIATIVSFS